MTAEATAEAVRALGRRSVAVPADTRTAPAVDAVADAAEAALGGVDILVNNAGISLYRAIVDCSEDEWDAHLDIMAKATFLTIRRLGPAMMERGWGRIVNLGLVRRPAQLHDEVLRAVLRREVRDRGAHAGGRPGARAARHGERHRPRRRGDRDDGGRVGARGRAPRIPAADVKEEYRQRLILGRFETPDDIAGGVLFLCSPLGDQVTGSHLIVSGGLPFHA